jgi:mono/diheme cytochrome c family protein
MLYDEHCSSCHGEKLRSSGAIPDLRELGAGDRARFDMIVADGKDQMPSWQGVISSRNGSALGLHPLACALIIEMLFGIA